MTPMRALAFGLGCLAAGWLAAGFLQALRAPVVVDVVVLGVLCFAVAWVGDRLSVPRRGPGISDDEERR